MLVDFGVARALGAEAGPRARSPSARRATWRPRSSPAARVSRAHATSSASPPTLWTLLIGTPPRYGDVLKLDRHAPGPAADDRRRAAAGWRCCPSSGSPRAAAFAEALGVPLTARPRPSLARALGRGRRRAARVMEAIVRTAAGMFDAAACSIALTDPPTASSSTRPPGAPARAEVVGMRLPPGQGIAGAVVATRRRRFRARLPQGPALRPAVARRHRLRALHDGRRAAHPRRQDDRRAHRARPPRRRPLSARGPRQGRAVRRPRARRDGRRAGGARGARRPRSAARSGSAGPPPEQHAGGGDRDGEDRRRTTPAPSTGSSRPACPAAARAASR